MLSVGQHDLKHIFGFYVMTIMTDEEDLKI